MMRLTRDIKYAFFSTYIYIANSIFSYVRYAFFFETRVYFAAVVFFQISENLARWKHFSCLCGVKNPRARARPPCRRKRARISSRGTFCGGRLSDHSQKTGSLRCGDEARSRLCAARGQFCASVQGCAEKEREGVCVCVEDPG